MANDNAYRRQGHREASIRRQSNTRNETSLLTRLGLEFHRTMRTEEGEVGPLEPCFSNWL
jgi:hypothetical protein